jgi:lipopolysaccharide transport system permease protein
VNETTVLGAPSASQAGDAPVTLIRARHRWFEVNLAELWEYRELLYFFIWRDLKIRYKQTVIGVAWAVIQPLFTMIVFSIFFGRLAGLPSDGIPHPIFYYTALLPWTYFANALSQASNVIVAHQQVIKKVYFARVLLPVSAVLSGLADFAVASVILVGMMLVYGIVPTWKAFWLLPLLLLAILTAMAVSLWLSALNALYRDVRYAVPFLLQFWMFASPVAYPASLVPDQWRWLYGLNPMAGVIEGFRWALAGAGPAPGPMLAASSAVVLFVLVTGFFYFQRMERTVADVV